MTQMSNQLQLLNVHKYSNLQGKTFLDFTKDQTIINLIIDDTDKDYFVKNVSPLGRYLTFMEFAEIIKDWKLKKEVEKQFPNMFNE